MSYYDSVTITIIRSVIKIICKVITDKHKLETKAMSLLRHCNTGRTSFPITTTEKTSLPIHVVQKITISLIRAQKIGKSAV